MKTLHRSVPAADCTAATVGDARHLDMTLPAPLTSALLTTVPTAFRAGVEHVLLTTLFLATLKWRETHGLSSPGSALVLNVEGHGRDAIAEGVDLSRTVGWFTTLYPLRLHFGDIDVRDAWNGGPAIGRLLKQVKEQLRRVPDRGIGYGVLRYLNPATAAELQAQRTPDLAFNYLGRVGAGTPKGAWSSSSTGPLRGAVDPHMRLPHAITLNAQTLEGENGPVLHAQWTWLADCVDADAIADLSRAWITALERLAAHAALARAGGRSPSDVPLVSLTQREIERLEAEEPLLEDILPLSPLQQGLLFHAVYDNDGLDVYTTQLVLEVEGRFDPVLMRASAQRLLQRHANLRTRFLHEGVSHPVQLVLADAQIPWTEIDVSECSPEEQEHRIRRWLDDERRRRFDLSKAPLLRVGIVTLGPRRHRLAILVHHILLDGWSMSLAVQELLTLYAEPERRLPAVEPYRSYLSWIAGQDTDAARRGWHEVLDGISEGTMLAPRPTKKAPFALEELEVVVDESIAAAASALARRSGWTLNNVLQAAWALVSRGSQQKRMWCSGSRYRGGQRKSAGSNPWSVCS